MLRKWVVSKSGEYQVQHAAVSDLNLLCMLLHFLFQFNKIFSM